MLKYHWLQGEGIDMLDQLTIILLSSIGGVIVLSFLIMLIVVYRHQYKAKKNIIDQPVIIKDDSSWHKALGGKDNIKEIEFKGSRLIVRLNDNSLLEKEELHNLGASSVITSEDKITIVLKNNAEEVAKLLQ